MLPVPAVGAAAARRRGGTRVDAVAARAGARSRSSSCTSPTPCASKPAPSASAPSCRSSPAATRTLPSTAPRTPLTWMAPARTPLSPTSTAPGRGSVPGTRSRLPSPLSPARAPRRTNNPRPPRPRRTAGTTTRTTTASGRSCWRATTQCSPRRRCCTTTTTARTTSYWSRFILLSAGMLHNGSRHFNISMIQIVTRHLLCKELHRLLETSVNWTNCPWNICLPLPSSIPCLWWPVSVLAWIDCDQRPVRNFPRQPGQWTPGG